ncbi:protein kinase regulatory subunit ATG17 KNAG_0B06510 [Huiozyma naganishii CBS 8797]|uniref:Autophagy-related protein 17 n=1 Tax=Huiozyma naganishii (strain ATCC MYA-139 / BCRC 22969 / CBS 8797 / KCTC 17520 / NBRC 10181 / NCYC 3082 / Yp74L-3) TaxID=1071383 RepID=J7S446_HUIN7|nr:hypothetical protein KNAG_0B06510 [Kazachstania naganishii CBS 8797]CCK69079.1 hypothetical protein KNAG_0B06510 [Kazachstania naganishii CBS 8797]
MLGRGSPGTVAGDAGTVLDARKGDAGGVPRAVQGGIPAHPEFAVQLAGLEGQMGVLSVPRGWGWSAGGLPGAVCAQGWHRGEVDQGSVECWCFGVRLVSDLQRWQDKIDREVELLDSVRNELSSPDGTRDSAVLGDYISRENLDLLRGRLEEIPTVETHIANITNQYRVMVRKLEEKLLQGKVRSLSKCFDRDLGIENEQVALLMTEYHAKLLLLEEELVELLQSLTDHFDKCKLLLQLSASGTESDSGRKSTDYLELLEVVQTDDSQLGAITRALCDTIDDIDAHLLQFQKLLDTKTGQLDKSLFAVQEVILQFEKNVEYLTIFQDIGQLITNFKELCGQDIQLVQGLVDFFGKYRDSYDRLLQEAQRRRQLSTRMQATISECLDELQTLQDDDFTKRTKFLEQNGNYLPENIWPDQIDDFSPLFTLEYTIKKV